MDETWGWTHKAGSIEGTTQPSQPRDIESNLCVWEHPIDLHFETVTLQRWPQFVLKIYLRSPNIQRDEFCAYAVCTIPTIPGIHTFTCRAWRPMDERSLQSDEFRGLWTGLYPHCLNDSSKELLERPGWDASNINTQGVGSVHFRLFVVTKGVDALSFSDPRAERDSMLKDLGHGQDGVRKSYSNYRSGHLRRPSDVPTIGTDEGSDTPGSRHSEDPSRDDGLTIGPKPKSYSAGRDRRRRSRLAEEGEPSQSSDPVGMPASPAKSTGQAGRRRRRQSGRLGLSGESDSYPGPRLRDKYATEPAP